MDPPLDGDDPFPPPLDGTAPPVEAGLDVASLGQRAVGQLVVRAFVVRGITLLGTIALARLLTPAEFGAFAVITVVVAFLAILGDFGWESLDKAASWVKETRAHHAFKRGSLEEDGELTRRVGE